MDSDSIPAPKIKKKNLNKINNNNSKDFSYNDQIIRLIDKKFISYKKIFYENNKEIWWPNQIKYGGKKYYTQSVSSELIKKDKTEIIYFCTNHRINTVKKKILFKNNPCNGKIKFNRLDNNFYWLADHNDICDNKYPKLYDNSGNITENVYKFADFKEYLIEYLNKNPIMSYNKFKDHAIKSYLEGDYDLYIRKNTFSNIFYPWRKNSKIFNWNSVFDNNTTLTGEQSLKDVSFSFLYTPDGKHLFWHKHLVWMSDFHINRIINSSHLYIDGTFITTKDYYQVLVIMYYDNNSQKKIPGCFILINNKYESGYIKCLNEFKRLITIEDTYKIHLKSITVDFEKALINALYISVIPWPVFLSFIINEENYYKNILLNYDSTFKIKNININKIENANKNENKDSPNKIHLIDNCNNKKYYLEKKFLKYDFYSCRYDSYFFLQAYAINNYINKHKINKTGNLKIFYNIGEFLLNLKNEELDIGFWEIINKYNLDKCGFLDKINGYKEMYPISDIFNFLKNEKLFSIKRKELVSCINCGTNVLTEDYIFPLISIYLEKLNKNSLNDILDSIAEPFSSSCII